MERTIYVGKEELLEWLAKWGEVKEGDELIKMVVGYTQDVGFVVESPDEEE